MNRKSAFFLSILFHPVFVNLLALFLLLKLFPYLDYGLSNSAKWFYLLFVFATTSAIPILVVAGMKWFHYTHNFLLEEKEDRRIPYAITAAFYLFDFYFFQRIHAPKLIEAFLLGSASVVVALLVINSFNKISIHMASFGLLTAVIVAAAGNALFDVRILLPLVFLATGITASARLFAGAHNLQQLLSGYVVGFFFMWFLL